MRFRHTHHDGKPQPTAIAAIIAQTKEPIENPMLHVGRDAGAAVADAQRDAL